MIAAYVAGKWARRAEARAVMEQLRAHGHDITHDWTKEDPDLVDGGYWAMCAAADVQAVENADVFVLLHDPSSRGAFVELGLALAMGVPVVVVDGKGHHPAESCPIFFYLPEVQHVATPGEAVAAVDAMAMERIRARARRA